jgi:phosphomevalonate kinase
MTLSDATLKKTVAVSAPGKVLLAGGYLVLDRQYTGLVFGLDARIHVHIQPIPTTTGVTLSEVIVRSPQFEEATWEYGYRLTPDDGGIVAHQLRAYVSDPTSAVFLVLQWVLCCEKCFLCIDIHAWLLVVLHYVVESLSYNAMRRLSVHGHHVAV